VDDGRVVAAEFPADIRQAQVCELADEVHRDLPRLGGVLVLERAAQNLLLDGVEAADLGDDEAGRRQAVGFAAVHVLDRAGDVRHVERHPAEIAIGEDFFDGALNLPHVRRDIFRNIVADIVGQLESETHGLVLDDGHARLVVGRLNVRDKAPFKPRFETVLQTQHLVGRPVGRQNDLAPSLIEVVEGVEEFLLRGILAGNKLDVVDEEEIGAAVFAAELNVPPLLKGRDQFVCKLIAFDVDDVVAWVRPVQLVGNRVEQMRLAEAGRSVDEKRIIGLGRIVCNGQGGRVRKPVRGTDDEVVKGKLRIELHERRFFLLILVGLHFLLAEHDQFDFGIEQLAHRVLDVIGASAEDDVFSELGGRVEDQSSFGQLHNLDIVKPGGNDGRRQAGFHVAENLGPDIGGRIHRRLLSGKNVHNNTR